MYLRFVYRKAETFEVLHRPFHLTFYLALCSTSKHKVIEVTCIIVRFDYLIHKVVEVAQHEVADGLAWTYAQRNSHTGRETLKWFQERIDEANVRLLVEMFALGLFENPYRDPANADAVVAAARADERVYNAHQKSVVLMKNTDSVLPLTEEKLAGKVVYVEYFNDTGDVKANNDALRLSLLERGLIVTNDYSKADYAILLCDPNSGAYFSATAGYLELDICDGKVVTDVDTVTGVPVDTIHTETTMVGANNIPVIAETVHANGGKVIANIDFSLAFMPGNVEPYVDALLGGFDTFTDATIDVVLGEYNPTGVLPLTLPKSDAVIAVDENGNCISPNDVPGFAKDQYMPEEMKDENGKAYAYRDAAGNYYELNFGLHF